MYEANATTGASEGDSINAASSSSAANGGSARLNVNLAGLTGYALTGTVLVVLAIAALVGIQTYRLNGAQRDLHAEISAHASTVAVYNLKAQQATEEYRLIEAAWNDAVEQIEEVRNEEMARTRTVADAYARDYARLRKSIKDAAGPGGSLAPELACRTESDRTEAFRVLLDIYMRADGESAKLLESQASDIRALLAWSREVTTARSGPVPALSH